MENPTLPQTPAELVAALGFPPTLFGFTPDQRGYWYEPGLPWFTAELHRNPPVGYDGWPLIPFVSVLAGHDMGPRFPQGCAVHTVPIYEKKNLVVGRVYLYRYQDAETGEMALEHWPTPHHWRQFPGSKSRPQPHAQHLAAARQ